MAIDSLEAAIGCILVKSPENLCLNTKHQSPLMVMLVHHPIASYVVIFFQYLNVLTLIFFKTYLYHTKSYVRAQSATNSRFSHFFFSWRLTIEVM